MRWHTERNDIVLLADRLEFGRMVAFVTVQNEQSMSAFRGFSRMKIEMLNPAHTDLVRSPSVITDSDDAISW